ncbi:hypothetical protein BDU57DRAFT_515423 [Ampelomyces quisqualis]|uniref:Zn(2)-C6 fungal-type domain-containing protein n=1 Tax=Ampelomyces quisqualis TaxID=50730 RepID=A0A6A5QUS4_AMPQU|nr:hypothetical protein BDU57DRAFT_515423 [Ampelomyces quisqualis]
MSPRPSLTRMEKSVKKIYPTSKSSTAPCEALLMQSQREIPKADIPRHKKPKDTTIACTQCLTHDWKDCDGKAPCENCKLRGKSDKCKRVMCQYFKKDTCANLFCTMAHEGDGYSRLVPFTSKLIPSRNEGFDRRKG